MSVGIWVEVSLNNLTSNLSLSLANTTELTNLTSSYNLLWNSAVVMITASSCEIFGMTIAIILLRSNPQGSETVYRVFSSIGGVLSFASAICAAVYLAHLNYDLWTEAQAQSLVHYCIAILVVTFGLGAAVVRSPFSSFTLARRSIEPTFLLFSRPSMLNTTFYSHGITIIKANHDRKVEVDLLFHSKFV